ncbi:MAG: hypothetical protein L3J11_11050 [Draconibacterium sp.]|nr:hypothetical protein [Draconibacterium sp.]
MADKSRVKSNRPDFRSSIPEYNNEEILNVLKKRKQYQKEAAEIALKEAIKRGLINSEQDLFAEEFQEKPTEFSIFPTIENNRNRTKIRKSIARVLLISGAIPIVWGAIKIIEGQILEGSILIVLGAIWVYAATQQFKTVNLKMINLLLIMLAASVIYIIKLFVFFENPALLDFLIPVILGTLITYGLLFIHRMK